MNSKKQFSFALTALVALLALSGMKAEARVSHQPSVPTPSVPEPGTVGMLIAGGVAGAGLLMRARRK